MHQTIMQDELREDNAEIMRRVAAGESFTVTVQGHPVADLVPRQDGTPRRRRLIPAAEFDAALAKLPPIDADLWRKDMREADDILGDVRG